jgi:hypothetical protein
VACRVIELKDINRFATFTVPLVLLASSSCDWPENLEPERCTRPCRVENV